MKEDLKQYMTNLLYYAHFEAKDMDSLQFDQWVDEMIEGIDEYFKSECCHPFERVISAGALHNCTVCGQNIEVWKEYSRK